MFPTTMLDTTRLTTALADRYRIERDIGSGGMATVYLARDLKHNRQVAIKVLRPELSAILGAERFLKEIEVTANLQHPQILPLFDSGEAAGFLYYVMPYNEGESLRARLLREKQLGVEESVRIARDVLSALDYANRHGIVHRDVKPENILLNDGRALVADFGIALAVRNAGGARITETGLSLGTPGYMSPEQATGERQVDARSDIYAVGCVLYEMLVGEPPHTGPTVQAVLAAVVAKEPESLLARRGAVPRNVAAATHKALNKVPADRFETAGAFEHALGDPTFSASLPGIGEPVGRSRRTGARALIFAAIAALVAGVGGAAAAWRVAKRSADPPLSVHFYLPTDSTRTLDGPMAISPDGSEIVFAARTSAGVMLFDQRLTEFEARPIPGTLGTSSQVFFSADGSYIGFVKGQTIHRVRTDGSGFTKVAEFVGDFSGAAWAGDGSLVYATSPPSALFRVAADGATPTPIAIHWSRAGENIGALHSMLPSGDAILCRVHAETVPDSIAVISLASGAVRLVSSGTQSKYVAPGFLIRVRDDGAIMAQPFDLERRAVTGPARRIAQSGVQQRSIGEYDLSRAGTLVFNATSSSSSELELIDRTGRARALPAEKSPWGPRFSPDGSKVAYGSIAGRSDLWVTDIRDGARRRLSTGGANGADFNDPAWSRSGRSLALSAFSLTDSLHKHIYTMPSDGSGAPRQLVSGDHTQYPTDWTPDDKNVVFIDYRGDVSSVQVTPVGGGAARILVGGTFNAGFGRVSPDGRWLAFESDESGASEIYTQPYPGPGARRLISRGGGRMPVWSHSGRELFYARHDSIIAVQMLPATGGASGAPERAIRVSLILDSGLTHYDISPDDRTFVAVTIPIRSDSRIAVITNVLTALPH